MIADSLNGKVVFVHIPRTSGTSIEASITPPPENIKHLRASQLKSIVGDVWNSTYRFTFVRNPFDRLISLFHAPYYKEINKLGGNSLEFFLEKYFIPSWEYGFTQNDYLDESINDVFYFERRHQDIETLNSRLAKYEFKIDHSIMLKVTARPVDYREFYNTTTKKWVENLFEDDLNRFGYVF